MVSGAFTSARDLEMSDCLNLKTLAALREIEEPGQMVFTTKLINVYLEDTRERLNAFRIAHQSGDCAVLAKVAHAVKGSSLNVGADGLAALMKTIEMDAKKGTLCAPDQLVRIEALFRQVGEELNAYKG